MKLEELKNPRVSYQVIITFDLEGAETSKYAELRVKLERELYLETKIYLSKSDGGGVKQLPFNTLAALYEKDSTESETKDYFEKELKKAFTALKLKGRFVVVVAQNWAVAASTV